MGSRGSLGVIVTIKKKENIPVNELAIRRKISFEATDGHVGHVDEFLIDPKNDVVTYLVVHEGHFWKLKVITIPMSQTDHFDNDTVYLK
jgi:PRC-barrel domain